MKKITSILSITTLIFVSILAFASCKVKTPEHTHELTEVAEKPATCSENGAKTYYTCSGCDLLFADAEGESEIAAPEAIEKLPHTEERVEGRAATCTEKGLTEGKKCSVCDATIIAQEEIPLAAHAEETVAGKAATCTEKGLTEGKECRVCGGIIVAQEELEALGHAEEVIEGKAATCTQVGFTEGKKCSTCGEILVAQAQIDSIGHKDENSDLACDVCGTELCAEHVPSEAVNENVVDPTCTADGSYNVVVRCSVCSEIISSKKTVVDALGHTESEAVQKNVIESTCMLEGSYDSVVRCSVCKVELSRETIVTDKLPHDFSGETLEGDEGFYKVCQNEGCNQTEAADVPEKSYKAFVNNSFTTTKKNSYVFKYGEHGAYGIITNGSFTLETDKGSPASGGIGSLDKNGSYVIYEFVLDKPGTVDIIWNVAGTHWKGDMNSNEGITNLKNCGRMYIDGKAVDINGVKLPGGTGNGMGTSVWWNLNNVVISGVALDAGTHTFKYETYLEYYGPNVASMTVCSDKEIGVKAIESVRTVDLIEEDGQIYYQMTMTVSKFTKQEDIKFWNEIGGNNIYFNFESFVTDENGLTTARINMTNQATAHDPIAPHMSVGGVNFINNSNNKGDVLNPSNNKIDYEETLIKANGKSYLLYTYYQMPALLVVAENYIRISSVDLFIENNKVYYTLTYRVIGYDPNSVQFFDSNTIYAAEVIRSAGCFVTYKIDATNLTAIWPHLRVNGKNWDGTGNQPSGNGDVKFTEFKEKTVTLNGKNYTLKNQYDMPSMTA